MDNKFIDFDESDEKFNQEMILELCKKYKEQSSHWRKCYNMELENYSSLKEQFHIFQSELQAKTEELNRMFTNYGTLEETHKKVWSELEAMKQTNSGKFGMVQLLKNQRLEKEIAELKYQNERSKELLIEVTDCFYPIPDDLYELEQIELLKKIKEHIPTTN